MSDDHSPKNPEVVEEAIKEMKIKGEESSSDGEMYETIRVEEVKPQLAHTDRIELSVKLEVKSATQSPKKPRSASRSPTKAKTEPEEIVGGEITLKLEPGQPPKLTRTASHKVPARIVQMFDDYQDKTEEATGVFQVITQCSYSAKYLGSTEHAMECDCAEEWDAATKTNHACGDDSDCINRATKMECFGDCGCGAECQNQRFQRQEYAKVAVIKTEKKGYGLRADADLQANDFIYEYIGEVIHEGQFRRRMVQYDEEGIKHFYFMSLSKGEFVDATKKGNLGRFCNHSCNPNCYVDKWVVGDKLRMGIFAERKIKAGEELVFNYNVDRYGADPQPCYCGEPNCTGFIGGKTQTERATKLSNTTIEALGIDDGDGWDTAVAKKPRKKKTGEDDEEYVNNVQPRSLDEEGVTKVMATLMQCKEKWIAVKLLGRIQSCTDEKVINRVIKMHGYQILNSALSSWKEDFNVVLQILDVLNHFPRLTKNKISDSKIEATVASLQGCGDERVESQAASLLKEWSTLETAYRIPRMKRDPNSAVERHNHFDRRESAREKARSKSRSKSRSRSRSLDAPKGPAAPTGPRNSIPQRNGAFFGARPPFRPPRPFNALPTGWFVATANDKTYYYSANGQTQWTRPTVPAAQPPPPPRPVSTNKALDDIIMSITNAKAQTPDKTSASATPKKDFDDVKKDKTKGMEKWQTYSEEKQKKLYENTLFPHIKYVVDKYKNKLPREDLKRFAKELSKKLVSSDFKNHRVENPTQISSRQEKQVKKYAKEYFDKAVAKKKEHDRKKAEKKVNEGGSTESPTNPKAETPVKKEEESDDGDVMVMSEDDDMKPEPKPETPFTPLEQVVNGDGLKRKREADNDLNGIKSEHDDTTPNKRPRSITPPAPAPAPPPPPPPMEEMPEDSAMVDDSANYEDESSYDSSYFANGSRVAGEAAELTEPMEAVDQPPPPPPPPPPQVDPCKARSAVQMSAYLANGDFGPSSTPGSDEEQDLGLGSLLPDRSQYLEAQESM